VQTLIAAEGFFRTGLLFAVSTESSARKVDVGKKSAIEGVKVARISTISYFAVSQLKNQIECLRDQGMQVALICSEGPELSNVRFGAGLSYVAVDLARDFSPAKDLVALFLLIRIFRQYRFAIVHSTTPKAGLLTAISGFICRVPVRLHTFTGQRWATLKGAMHWLSRISDKVIARLNTCCYADSVSQRELLIRKKIVPARKIGVIGKGSLAGVDLDRFSRAKWASSAAETRRNLSISDSSKVILFIGRITGDKGIGELLSAFGQLSNLDYDADLVLLGPLDPDYEGIFSHASRPTATNPRIHYLGYRDCPERYLAITDVLCLPSYREGFGTVVIEAAAMAVPTVGTKITGLCDAIVDGVTGILVPPRNETALFNALRRLLENPELLSKLGSEARARCITDFDAKLINCGLLDEYARLLQHHFSRKRRRK